MTSESDQPLPSATGEEAPSRSSPGYARGYCTICGDREPDQVSLASAAKRLVCAACFKEFGEPSPCLRCGRKVYDGDWVVSETDTDPGSSESRISTQEFFFCEPCLEHHWPACLQVVAQHENATEPLLEPPQGVDPLQLLASAVLGDFHCPGCNELIEPDFDVCGGCGATNPLRKLGLI